MKKDNNKGYITLNDFKDILYQDLKIDYKSDINNFQTFLDFIVSDKMIEGELIIETKRIINVIKTYSGRDGPNEVENKPNQNERQDYEKQMIERKQYNDKYNNEENEGNNIMINIIMKKMKNKFNLKIKYHFLQINK